MSLVCEINYKISGNEHFNIDSCPPVNIFLSLKKCFLAMN